MHPHKIKKLLSKRFLLTKRLLKSLVTGYAGARRQTGKPDGMLTAELKLLPFGYGIIILARIQFVKRKDMNEGTQSV